MAAHRVAWAWLDARLSLASIATAAGLLALAGTMPDRVTSAALLACTAGDGIGAVRWCAVLAIRTRSTPPLPDLGAGELDNSVRLGAEEEAEVLRVAGQVRSGACVRDACPAGLTSVGSEALRLGASRQDAGSLP